MVLHFCRSSQALVDGTLHAPSPAVKQVPSQLLSGSDKYLNLWVVEGQFVPVSDDLPLPLSRKLSVVVTAQPAETST